MARRKFRQLKFLIDECLHPRLAEVARAKGHHAQHVNDVGKNGRPDTELFEYAVQNDMIIVTNNAADFRKLCRRAELHAGVVVLVPNVPPSKQNRLFEAAIAEIGKGSEPINKLIEVRSETEIEVFDTSVGE
jgi:predicted nuclease of predicted toxin-antitoxin system